MDKVDFDGEWLADELGKLHQVESTSDDVFTPKVVEFIKTGAVGEKEKDTFVVAQLRGEPTDLEKKRVEALKIALGVQPDQCNVVFAGSEGWGNTQAIIRVSFETKIPGLMMEYEMPPIKPQGPDGMAQNIGGMQEVVLRREKIQQQSS